MFSNAESINFRGKEVKQIVRKRDNAILYQKIEDDRELLKFVFTGTTLTQYDNGSLGGTDMVIDYGDGTVKTTTGGFGHTYSESGTYTVKISGVTSLRDYCFRSCTGLISITIPNTVTSFGEYCFRGCTDLVSIIIPNSVTNIGNYCFRECTSLTSITIPNNVTNIGNHCFDGCTGLTSVIVPNSVISFGDYCFFGCTGLTSINIPNTVTSLGISCFSRCTSLTSIDIPSNITSLKDYCFTNCTSLTSIDIPNNITSLGDYCFANCTDLTSITLNWTTLGQIVTYTSNWIESANANLKFEIPKGTTNLYIEKGYPSDKLVEISDDETMNISVSVVYDNDNNNQDGNRPTEILISLTVSGETIKQATITAENNWTYTFSGLLIEDGFSYQIVSDQIDYYLSNVDRVDNEFIITETYSPPETYSSIRIEFDDDTSEYRPESIMATLNNGMTVTLTEQNGWASTIYNLPSIINHEPMTYDWNIEDISYYQISQKLNFNEYLTIFTLKLEIELPSTGGLMEIYAPSFTEDNPTPTNSLDSGYQVSQSNGELTLIGGCISDGWSNDDLWQCDYDVKWNGTRYQWFRTLMALPNTALLGGWEGCLVNPQPGLGSNVQRDNTDCLTVVHENILNNPSTPWIHITITKVSPTTLVVTKSGDTTNNGTVTFTNCELLSSYEKMSVGALSNNGSVMGKPTFKNFKVTKPKVIKDDVEDGEELS